MTQAIHDKETMVENQEQKQMWNLPSHLVAHNICANMHPADVMRGIVGTSKYLQDLVKHHEIELVHMWLARCTSSRSFRLEPEDIQGCGSPMRLLLCLVRCNLITNGHLDAPMTLFNGATPPILLAGPLDPERWQQGLQTAHSPRGTLFGWHIARNGGSGWAWQPEHVVLTEKLNHSVTLGVTDSSPNTWWLHAYPLRSDVGMGVWSGAPSHARLLTAPDGDDFVVSPGEVVSSYRWCELQQDINLVARFQRYGMGVKAACALLDASPRLRFSVHVGAHTGCRAEYSVTVSLLPGSNSEALAGFSTNVQQLPEDQWHRVGCVFEGYPPGVRRVQVVLQGRDGVFWSGHNGARFARCELSVIMK